MGYHFPLCGCWPVQTSDCHNAEDFCQIKLFPSIVRQNTSICLIGVLMRMGQYIQQAVHTDFADLAKNITMENVSSPLISQIK